MEFITSNLLIITLISCAVLLSAILYYFYKKKKNKKIFVPSKPEIFNELGLTENSGAVNEHFQFPESKDSMSDETFNKFKIEQKEENTEKDEKQEKTKQEEVKQIENELNKLKKDYKETSEDIQKKNERGFSIDLENGILSHEILRKRNKKH